MNQDFCLFAHRGLYDFYHYFYMLTNILYYVSSAINPILYNLVSATYRQIFFSTLHYFCRPCCRSPRRRPHPLTRHSISISSNHTLSTNIVKETVYWLLARRCHGIATRAMCSFVLSPLFYITRVWEIKKEKKDVLKDVISLRFPPHSICWASVISRTNKRISNSLTSNWNSLCHLLSHRSDALYPPAGDIPSRQDQIPTLMYCRVKRQNNEINLLYI